jgi:2-dehydropantoate 2-reductase
MTRIAVVGPGSVGTFFAAHLAAAGRDVVACARRPFDEYVVDSKTAPVTTPARVLTDPILLEASVDWVLVAVKAHQTAGAAPWLRRLCGEGTTVVAVQNGVEGEARLAPLVGSARVLAAVVYCGAELLSPGHIRHDSAGYLILPDQDASHRLAEIFVGTGAQVRISAAFADEAYRKLGINTVLNGITALTERNISVLDQPDIREIGRGLLQECWAVGRAEGSTLTDDDIDPLLDAFAGNPGVTSMLQDRRAGRPTEHDALYGAVIRIGRRHGIPTPLHQTFAALLAAGDPVPAGSSPG